MPATKTERQLASSIASHRSWAATSDRTARTAPANAALIAKIERQVDELDPDGLLTPKERAQRASHLKSAYFQELSLKAARGRRQAAEIAAEAEAAEAELEALGGTA